MIRNIPFGSCYVYSPAGQCAVSRRSQLLCSLLKAGDAQFLSRYAARVRHEVFDHGLFCGYFDARTLLIPVPGSRPRSPGTASAAERLAAALLEAGLGGLVWTGLKRVSPVRKSATAPGFTRPTAAKHYASFTVEAFERSPQRILLVDDVVTKGRTLIAAATRIYEAFPQAEIRAFALLRTMGMIAEVERLVDPCVGQIRWRGGDAHRCP
ncbi:MAG TPA: phosphoribosyltransferase [Steroidobacteraceae bacterium]|nr:phosphoribosyltransferase [Steroidobacteraceae bacterium]